MEFEKLCAIVAETLEVDANALTPETEFVEDLGADSLDMFKIAMGMEDVFAMDFDVRQVNAARTLADVMKLVGARPEERE